MSFVVRTDKLGDPRYFAGAIELRVTGALGVIICQTPFDAVVFEDRQEPEELIANALSDCWTVSEIDVGSSPNLRRKR